MVNGRTTVSSELLRRVQTSLEAKRSRRVKVQRLTTEKQREEADTRRQREIENIIRASGAFFTKSGEKFTSLTQTEARRRLIEGGTVFTRSVEEQTRLTKLGFGKLKEPRTDIFIAPSGQIFIRETFFRPTKVQTTKRRKAGLPPRIERVKETRLFGPPGGFSSVKEAQSVGGGKSRVISEARRQPRRTPPPQVIRGEDVLPEKGPFFVAGRGSAIGQLEAVGRGEALRRLEAGETVQIFPERPGVQLGPAFGPGVFEKVQPKEFFRPPATFPAVAVLPGSEKRLISFGKLEPPVKRTVVDVPEFLEGVFELRDGVPIKPKPEGVGVAGGFQIGPAPPEKIPTPPVRETIITGPSLKPTREEIIRRERQRVRFELAERGLPLIPGERVGVEEELTLLGIKIGEGVQGGIVGVGKAIVPEKAEEVTEVFLTKLTEPFTTELPKLVFATEQIGKRLLTPTGRKLIFESAPGVPEEVAAVGVAGAFGVKKLVTEPTPKRVAEAAGVLGSFLVPFGLAKGVKAARGAKLQLKLSQTLRETRATRPLVFTEKAGLVTPTTRVTVAEKLRLALGKPEKVPKTITEAVELSKTRFFLEREAKPETAFVIPKKVKGKQPVTLIERDIAGFQIQEAIATQPFEVGLTTLGKPKKPVKTKIAELFKPKEKPLKEVKVKVRTAEERALSLQRQIAEGEAGILETGGFGKKGAFGLIEPTVGKAGEITLPRFPKKGERTIHTHPSEAPPSSLDIIGALDEGAQTVVVTPEGVVIRVTPPRKSISTSNAKRIEAEYIKRVFEDGDGSIQSFKKNGAPLLRKEGFKVSVKKESTTEVRKLLVDETPPPPFEKFLGRGVIDPGKGFVFKEIVQKGEGILGQEVTTIKPVAPARGLAGFVKIEGAPIGKPLERITGLILEPTKEIKFALGAVLKKPEKKFRVLAEGFDFTTPSRLAPPRGVRAGIITVGPATKVAPRIIPVITPKLKLELKPKKKEEAKALQITRGIQDIKSKRLQLTTQITGLVEREDEKPRQLIIQGVTPRFGESQRQIRIIDTPRPPEEKQRPTTAIITTPSLVEQPKAPPTTIPGTIDITRPDIPKRPPTIGAALGFSLAQPSAKPRTAWFYEVFFPGTGWVPGFHGFFETELEARRVGASVVLRGNGIRFRTRREKTREPFESVPFGVGPWRLLKPSFRMTAGNVWQIIEQQSNPNSGFGSPAIKNNGNGNLGGRKNTSKIRKMMIGGKGSMGTGLTRKQLQGAISDAQKLRKKREQGLLRVTNKPRRKTSRAKKRPGLISRIETGLKKPGGKPKKGVVGKIGSRKGTGGKLFR